MRGLCSATSLRGWTVTDAALTNVLDRLQGVRRCGGQYQALCPAHDDTKPSLSIRLTDDRVLLHCHAGCDTKDVLSAIGLTFADLYVGDRQPPMRGGRKRDGQDNAASESVSTASSPPQDHRSPIKYKYTNAEGEVVFTKVRARNKQFRVETPPGRTVSEIDRPLFRLPQLLATPADVEILIVEGERDVLTAESHGCVATTCGGATQWGRFDWSPLHGRSVVLVPDADRPGALMMERIGQLLYGKAATIKLLTLPNVPAGGDLSDWFGAGGDVDALHRLILAAPAWRPKPRDGELVNATPILQRFRGGPSPDAEETPQTFDTMRILDRPHARSPMELATGTVTTIGGSTGVGKSALCEALLWGICDEHRNARVLLASAEMMPEVVIARELQRLTGVCAQDIRLGRLSGSSQTRVTEATERLDEIMPRFGIIHRPRSMPHVRKACAELDPDVVVVDYAQLIAGNPDNPRAAIDELMMACRDIADEGRAVVLISALSRTRLPTKFAPCHPDELIGLFRESSGIEYTSDRAAILRRVKPTREVEMGEGEVLAELAIVKNRFGALGGYLARFHAPSLSWRINPEPREA